MANWDSIDLTIEAIGGVVAVARYDEISAIAEEICGAATAAIAAARGGGGGGGGADDFFFLCLLLKPSFLVNFLPAFFFFFLASQIILNNIKRHNICHSLMRILLNKISAAVAQYTYNTCLMS